MDLTGDESSDSDDIISIHPRKISRTSSQSTASGSGSVSRTESEADTEISRLKRSRVSKDALLGSPRLADQTSLGPGMCLSTMLKDLP